MQKQFDTHEKSGASVGISDSLKVTQKKKLDKVSPTQKFFGPVQTNWTQRMTKVKIYLIHSK